MMNGTSTHFVLSAGFGSDSGYSRGRNDDDRGGGGGYNRGRSNNDDRGSGGGYNRGRNDHHSNNDDNGGSSGYNRSRNDYNNSGGGSSGNDSGLETQRDTIFIQNLPRHVTPDELKDVFSQIGVIKVNIILYIYRYIP